MQTKTNKVQKKCKPIKGTIHKRCVEITKKMFEYTTIMNALNTIEYQAELYKYNSIKEQNQLAKAYTKVANFISKYAGM